jgi:hypothetical protein
MLIDCFHEQKADKGAEAVLIHDSHIMLSISLCIYALLSV